MNQTTKVIVLCALLGSSVFVACGAAESSEDLAAAGSSTSTGAAGAKTGTGSAGTGATSSSSGGCSVRPGAVSQGSAELAGLALALGLTLAGRRRRRH